MSPRRSISGIRWVALLVLLSFGIEALAAAPATQLQLLQRQHIALRQKYLTSLETLAEWCTDHDLATAAGTVRAAGDPAREDVLPTRALPNTVQPALSPDLPANQRHWQSQLRLIRSKQGLAVYRLSRRVLKAGFPSFAYDLVRESAACDPDLTVTRRLLGQVRYGRGWLTPFAASQRRKRYVQHKDFGWLPAKHVERYEQGERYFKRRWVSAARERELRKDFRNAWEVQTDHYLVRTNHSLEEGVALGKALEEVHRFFQSSFAAFFNSPEQMKRLFEGNVKRGRVTRPRPFVVHFYRDAAEYRRVLRPRIPQIEITNGLYMPEDRIVYFFFSKPVDEGFPQATVFHEATHQMFYESRSRQRPIAREAHFWIIEGIACYMESFRRTGTGYQVGDPKYVRFHWARHRWLTEGYYFPLEKFSSLGMRDFQLDPNISRNYSQASGLVHFFLHYNAGVYRDALIRHLAQLYSPDRRIDVATLETLTGIRFAELDGQYHRYLKAQQESLDNPRPPRTPRQ